MKKWLVSFAVIIVIATNFFVLSEDNSGNLFSNVSISMLNNAFAVETTPPVKKGNSPHDCYRLNEDGSQTYCGEGNYCDGDGSSCSGSKLCHNVCF